ncbi:MAG: Gfo/Idh/MocA family oxidoreductase [Planctomycetes bacterium]|nr:Gfo/Idh/MocA family oxidoreductase [Planctomycetota bacterium]
MTSPVPTRSMQYGRRRFLRTAVGVVAAGPLVIPARALGAEDAVAPSNRIALGFIGVGMMGQGHLRHCLQSPEAHVVAVCDVDPWRRENAKEVTHQSYAASKPGGSYQGCMAYNDLRELLARRDVDAVVIATGDNWHGTATVLAAKAGKDIYCEKPASKTIAEARAMVDAARRYDRVAQIGLQQRSTPEFIKACRLVRTGAIGKVRSVHVGFPGTSTDVNLPGQAVPEGLDWDQWLGPAPWHPFNGRFHIAGRPPHVVPWHFCRDFGGGNLTSNAVHAFDVVQWGLGMDQSGPLEIIPPETGRVPVLTYKYADGVELEVNWTFNQQSRPVPEGWNPKTRIQNFGALFVGSDGWIHVGRQGYLDSFPKAIIKQADNGPGPHRPVNNHHQNWFQCIKTRQRPACDVSVGCRSTIVSHLGCIAHWTGQALQWDPVAEEFIGNDRANRLRRRAMRGMWRV